MPAEPSSTFIIEDDVAIAAGATIVIAKSADTGVNGGLFVTVEYGSENLVRPPISIKDVFFGVDVSDRLWRHLVERAKARNERRSDPRLK